MSARLAAACAVLLLAVTACSSSSSGSHSTGLTFNKATPRYHHLVAAADLAVCPASSATPVATKGGLPNLTLECLGNGPSVHLAGVSGKPMVVNAWAAWCGPCRAEAGYLTKAYDHDQAAVSFLGVDTEDDWDSALNFGTVGAKPPIRYPSVYDENRSVITAFHQPGLPLTVFVSRTGHVVDVQRGPLTSYAQLQHDITTYLHVAT